MSGTASSSPYRLTVLLGLANQLSVYLAGFLLIAVVSHNFGKAFFGTFAFYQAVFAHVLVLSVMGFDKLIVFRVSHHNQSMSRRIFGGKLLGNLAGRSATIFLLTAAALVPLLLLASETPGQEAFWLAAFSASTLVAVLHNLQSALFQANKAAEVPLAVSTAVNLAKVLGLLAIHATGTENPLWIFAYVAVPPFAVAITLHQLRTRFETAGDDTAIVPGDYAYSAKLMLTKLTHSGLEKTDLIMIGILLSATATAEYAVAARLALIVPLGNVLLAPLFGPRIRYAIEQQQPDRVKREFNGACLFATAVGLAVLLPLAILGEFVLGLFGAYESSLSYLVVLGLAFFNKVALGPTGRTLYLMGHASYTLISNSVMLIAVIVTNLVLIQMLGVIGAAIGTYLCILAQNVADHLLLAYRERTVFVNPIAAIVALAANTAGFIYLLQ